MNFFKGEETWWEWHKILLQSKWLTGHQFAPGVNQARKPSSGKHGRTTFKNSNQLRPMRATFVPDKPKRCNDGIEEAVSLSFRHRLGWDCALSPSRWQVLSWGCVSTHDLVGFVGVFTVLGLTGYALVFEAEILTCERLRNQESIS